MNLKKIWWVVVLGLVLRLLVGAFTYHPDVGIVNFTSEIFLKEQNLNPYAFSGIETPDDLPLQYWVRLPFELMLRPLVDENIERQFLVDAEPLLDNPGLFWHLLIVKLPLILFDLGAGILLALFLPEVLRKKALVFWMINPMSLWATAAVGQVDILPTFFVVLALLLLQKGKLGFSSLALGIGGAMKSFPFLLAPFIIFTAKTWPGRLKLFLLTAIPWIVSVVPYLGSPDFRQNALFSPQLDKMLYAKVPLSGGEGIFITVVILVGLYLLYFARRERGSDDFMTFSTAAILLVLAFTHFHIQWFLWVVPFLIILVVKGLAKVQGLAVWGLALSLIGMTFLFESSLQVGLFSPLFPGLANTPGLAEILKEPKVTMLRSVFASLFAASAIFLSLTLILSRHRD